MMEKWIHWILLIYDRFKLNFDDSRINDTSALGWVIRDSNGIIKVAGCRHLARQVLYNCYRMHNIKR